jgi:hypothetical protein
MRLSLEKFTSNKILRISLIIGILAGASYFGLPSLSEFIMAEKKVEFNTLTTVGEENVAVFMRKYSDSVMYLTVLRFDFPRNSRVPIYRAFNNEDIKKIVYDRLKGGDGALPMFIEGDNSFNNQTIATIQGELRCEPFANAGLSRVWPDLVPRFTVSCRVPIPPAFDGGIRGYIVVHLNKTLTPYEMEALKLDLMVLGTSIYKMIR